MTSQWKPGVSGNPNGRPKGRGPFAAVRDEIAEHMPAIITRLAEQAKEGDVAAARLLMERIYPALKPVEVPVALELPGASLSDDGRAVLAAVASGSVPPSQGAALVAAIGALARVVEVDELMARVAALEERNAKP